MKRWIAIVLMVLLLMNAGTGALGAADGGTAERWTVEPETMPEELILFLDWFGWYGMFGSGEYDASAIGEGNNILGGAFELCLNFDAYPGEAAEQWIEGDPRGRWGWCYGYDGEKTDWILQNIFGYAPEDIARARAWGEDPAADFYYEDGMYYVFQGGVGGGFDCFPCYVETDGEVYYITYISYMGDGYTVLEGIHYAEMIPREIDGRTWWTLRYWSAAVPPSDGAVLGELAGEWVLAEEPDSGLNIDAAPDGSAVLAVRFYRMAAFTAEAISQPDGRTAIFLDTDRESGFSGWLTKEGDRISLRAIPMPAWGEDPWGGFFDGSFEFHRAGSAGTPAEAPAATEPPVPAADTADFTITPEELERAIEAIRQYYYTPGDGDQRITLQNGTDGWNYSRDYTFHNGQLAFAFIFDGTEEHRLYFKDDHMIRYIDENHTVYDFGDLAPFSDWEAWALEEAYTLVPAPAPAAESGDASPWLGVWYDGEESLEVTAVSDSAVTLIYHGLTDDGGSMFHSEYVLPFTDERKTSCAEPDSVLEMAGWRYSFTFHGDHITMSSRYPDRDFWK